MTRPQQTGAGFLARNPYTMEIDKSNRNCYSCGGFGHLARNYNNRRIRNRTGEGRRMNIGEQRGNGQNNLNGEGDLIVFDYIPVAIGLQCSQEQQIIYLNTTLIMETC